ncbi:mycothione reductase [Yimella sp. cx-51]|uniref:mycothione reductase n=1 Tax=Yimella sp. cx-51 TaxID=2770551 RepID=UPI00165DFED1|nr:mycothione reductase [Yimella sp. cx-51]MBC9956655.1 mycothione reductase [Yimella sp. cx-51]QTH38896.1 mycothione reductase [Yimella sp. cx-51]
MHFDLAIIGTGSGNSLVTPDFDGKHVAVIEKGLFGGTCLNVGCIPTKMFVYAAEVAESIRGASKYGIDAHLDRVRWRDIRDRVFGRIDPIEAGGRDYRVNGPGTTAYLGTARFTGPRALVVDVDAREEEVTADQIVIATGSTPVVPQAIRDSGVRFYTNEDVMRIDELPRRMTIVGGGYIAAEFAHVFGALGVEITIVTRGPQMLRAQDETVARAFSELAAQQWDVRFGTTVAGASQEGEVILLTLSDGVQLETDLLLVAAGREPLVPEGVSLASVELTQDGRVEVDEFGRTTADGVWSLGDVSSAYQLKHVANHEARVVAHNLTHPEALEEFDHRFVPAAVFTHPQVASVGLTEQQARDVGHDLTVKVQKYGDTAYGWAMEDTTSFVKLIADRRTGDLLGAHLMGPQASSLIQPIVQAMSFGQSAVGLARGQYWIHPAMAEVVENALLGLEFD